MGVKLIDSIIDDPGLNSVTKKVLTRNIIKHYRGQIDRSEIISVRITAYCRRQLIKEICTQKCVTFKYKTLDEISNTFSTTMKKTHRQTTVVRVI